MTDSLLSRFRQLAANRKSDELTAALLVNEALDPGVDTVAARARVNELAENCPRGVAPWAYLRELGFTGNRGNYVDLANSRIADVLATRRGIPISLGVLLVHLARRLGHDAQGINFPGHFLARVDGVLVDPFAFQTLTEAECLKMLEGKPHSDSFAVASSTMIAMRMLNNVKYQFMGMARWERVLSVLELQLALTPEAVQLQFETGLVWAELGAPDIATRIFRELLQSPGGGEIREDLLKRLKSLEGASTTWN